jgi:hypothetical protein
MCRAAVSQFASDINVVFDNPERGELRNKNDQGVTYTSILLNNAVQTFNDGALISNSRNNNLGGPYQQVGFDANTDRIGRELFSFNFFRLGTQSTDPFPNTSDQRRIMIINGSTREILFSFTPTGSSGEVRAAVTAQRQTMLDAINSVGVVSEAIDFNITNIEANPGSFRIDFESAQGLTEFAVMASADLQEFDLNLTENSTITESEPGQYQVDIDTSEFDEKLFIQIEHPE